MPIAPTEICDFETGSGSYRANCQFFVEEKTKKAITIIRREHDSHSGSFWRGWRYEVEGKGNYKFSTNDISNGRKIENIKTQAFKSVKEAKKAFIDYIMEDNKTGSDYDYEKKAYVPCERGIYGVEPNYLKDSLEKIVLKA